MKTQEESLSEKIETINIGRGGNMLWADDVISSILRLKSELKEDLKENWKHYQYNYNPSESMRVQKELFEKIDTLFKKYLGEKIVK
jgi:hypothetical protein